MCRWHFTVYIYFFFHLWVHNTIYMQNNYKLFFIFFLAQRQTTPNGYHISRDMNSPSQVDGDYKYGRFDASALHIAHALKQTELQKAYNKRREKPIDYYLVSIFSCRFYVII